MFKKDETGNRYGRLLVLYPIEQRTKANRCIRYMCLCDCEEYHVASGHNLRAGHIKSCGCLRREKRDTF